MAGPLEEAAVVHLDVEAEGLEESAQDLLGLGLVPVRRDGHAVHAHQGLHEPHEVASQRPKQAARVADRVGHGHEAPSKAVASGPESTTPWLRAKVRSDERLASGWIVWGEVME